MNELDIIKWMEERWIEQINIIYLKDGERTFQAKDINGAIQIFCYNPNLKKTKEADGQ